MMSAATDTDPTSLNTPNDLSDSGRGAVADSINRIVADAFLLNAKTKNFHWHMAGPHFRSYHHLLDEQGDAIFSITDPLAERVRKLGKRTIRSMGEMLKLSHLKENNADFVAPREMLHKLMNDNKSLISSTRTAHEICDEHEDVATASLLEEYIDAAESRTWFLFEMIQSSDRTGH